MNIHLDLKENSYDIIVERGILGKASELLNLDRRVLIVTDTGVPAVYAQTLANNAYEVGRRYFDVGRACAQLLDIYNVILK